LQKIIILRLILAFELFALESKMSINWSLKYLLNISGVDDQHKRLFYLLDQNEELYCKEKGNLINCIPQITSTLFELEQYAITHFLMEERAMADSHYPDLENHRRLHVKFTNDIQDFIRRINADKSLKEESSLDEFVHKLLKFLRNWIAHHIQIKDIEIKPYIKAL
jgi:hemerythrin